MCWAPRPRSRPPATALPDPSAEMIASVAGVWDLAGFETTTSAGAPPSPAAWAWATPRPATAIPTASWRIRSSS